MVIVGSTTYPPESAKDFGKRFTELSLITSELPQGDSLNSL
jgi:hypothetical protein